MMTVRRSLFGLFLCITTLLAPVSAVLAQDGADLRYYRWLLASRFFN